MGLGRGCPAPVSHTLIITPTERKVIAIAYISSDDLAWAIGDDDTWIAPLSTSVEVDDQGNVITTGQGSNTLTGIDAALALAKHYGAVLLTDVSADVAPVSGQAVNSKAVKAGLDYVRGFSSEFWDKSRIFPRLRSKPSRQTSITALRCRWAIRTISPRRNA